MQTMVQVVHKDDPGLELHANDFHWLTDDETARYQAISSLQRKQQFLAGHCLVRKMASRLCVNAIEDWVYSVDDNNQRRMTCRQPGIPGFYASLSHSGSWIAAGISSSPIGIDIETYSKQRDFIAIARHVFSESETGLLLDLPPEQLNRQFYLYWTLKESVAKQHGAGLKFEVSRAHSFLPAEETETASVSSWQCPEYVLAMAGGSVADVVPHGLCGPVKQLRWNNVPAN